jgi:hypothetical protein
MPSDRTPSSPGPTRVHQLQHFDGLSFRPTTVMILAHHTDVCGLCRKLIILMTSELAIFTKPLEDSKRIVHVILENPVRPVESNSFHVLTRDGGDTRGWRECHVASREGVMSE